MNSDIIDSVSIMGFSLLPHNRKMSAKRITSVGSVPTPSTSGDGDTTDDEQQRSEATLTSLVSAPRGKMCTYKASPSLRSIPLSETY